MPIGKKMILSQAKPPSLMFQTWVDYSSLLECNIYPPGVIIYQFWLCLCTQGLRSKLETRIWGIKMDLGKGTG